MNKELPPVGSLVLLHGVWTQCSTYQSIWRPAEGGKKVNLTQWDLLGTVDWAVGTSCPLQHNAKLYKVILCL